MREFPTRPFLYSELTALGISRRQLRDALDAQVIRPLLRNVYCTTQIPDSLTLRAQAATLVLPEHVVVSDHSAAWLHGIDAFDPTALDVPPDLDVVSFQDKRTRRAGFHGGRRALLEEDIGVVAGVPVTTALRTSCDLACLRGRSAALAVLDAFTRNFGLTKTDFEPMVRRYAGRRGVVQLRELITYATPLAESPGESWMRMAIIDAGLPLPKPQVWVDLRGVGRFRLDLAYPHLKIAIEYDGGEFHSTAEQRSSDERRRLALRQAGWIVIVVCRTDLTGAALDRWIGELHAAIRERRGRSRRQYPKPSPEARQAYHRRGLRP